ncbi:MAG: Sec-independent protein translocase protein TatB [Actinomycetota bacterium]|nr:Sec-independent protein translocase protein TatB [Actinomycetota bacterium]
MPQIGPLELIVVALVALIVFGPDKLPEIARTVGRTINELRRQAAEVRSEFTRGLDDDADEIDVSEPSSPSLADGSDSSNGAGPNA